jgi:putative nucleotidyltransferase with HDIG domain
VIDPFGGREDLAKKTVRTVGDPFRRFDEDGLRPVRAIRFSATLGFGIEKNTLAAIPKGLEKTRLVSVERFRDEFTKMLAADTPSTALKLLEETGVLALLIPELTACRGITQQDIRGYHRFDVLDHLFFACDGAPREKLTVRLAALFHDVGKPAVRAVSERTGGDGAVQPVITFYNHEKVSAELCAKILTRLRFPNHLADAVSHLVAEHMFFYEPSWTDAAVRRFVRRVTPEALEDIFDLRRADTYGMSGVAPSLQTGPWVANLLDLKERAAIVLSEKAVLDLKSLAVSGNDLVAAGIPAGKVLGAILRELLETVVDDPGENTREHLLGIAKNIYKKYEGSQ